MIEGKLEAKLQEEDNCLSRKKTDCAEKKTVPSWQDTENIKDQLQLVINVKMVRSDCFSQ